MKKILIVALILTTTLLSFSQTKTKSKKTIMKIIVRPVQLLKSLNICESLANCFK